MQRFENTERKRVPSVVLDTNVLISGVLNPEGSPGKILALLAKPGSFRLLAFREIFAEYHEVIHREKFGLSKEKIDRALKLMSNLASIVSPSHGLQITPDPDDNKFLECAVEGKADFIVTGNKKHYPFEEFRGIKIVSPAGFLPLL